MRRLSVLVTFVFSVLFTPTLLAAEPTPWTRTWRDHAVWYDGMAERADYQAIRIIYGQPRAYTARLFTNKERYRPATTTKAQQGGVEVFKFHQRHDIPTPNYAYHFSTMAYVSTKDLTPLKLEMGSQEDCGTTFKQFIKPPNSTQIQWLQSSYFPGEGMKHGSIELKGDTPVVYEDALPLVLRSYPFESPRDVELFVLPLQTDTHLTPVQPVAMVVRYLGPEMLDLPAGKIEAHRLSVSPQKTLVNALPPQHAAIYAFAVNGQTDEQTDTQPPAQLHVMVYFKAMDGRELKLKQQVRTAYWKF